MYNAFPLENIRVVAHLPGLIAGVKVGRGHGIATLEPRQVFAQFSQLRFIFLDLVLQEFAYGQVNHVIRVPFRVKSFQRP